MVWVGVRVVVSAGVRVVPSSSKRSAPSPLRSGPSSSFGPRTSQRPPKSGPARRICPRSLSRSRWYFTPSSVISPRVAANSRRPASGRRRSRSRMRAAVSLSPFRATSPTGLRAGVRAGVWVVLWAGVWVVLWAGVWVVLWVVLWVVVWVVLWVGVWVVPSSSCGTGSSSVRLPSFPPGRSRIRPVRCDEYRHSTPVPVSSARQVGTGTSARRHSSTTRSVPLPQASICPARKNAAARSGFRGADACDSSSRPTVQPSGREPGFQNSIRSPYTRISTGLFAE